MGSSSGIAADRGGAGSRRIVLRNCTVRRVTGTYASSGAGIPAAAATSEGRAPRGSRPVSFQHQRADPFACLRKQQRGLDWLQLKGIGVRAAAAATEERSIVRPEPNSAAAGPELARLAGLQRAACATTAAAGPRARRPCSKHHSHRVSGPKLSSAGLSMVPAARWGRGIGRTWRTAQLRSWPARFRSPSPSIANPQIGSGWLISSRARAGPPAPHRPGNSAQQARQLGDHPARVARSR